MKEKASCWQLTSQGVNEEHQEERKSETELEEELERLTKKQIQRNPRTGVSTVSLRRRSQRG